MSKQSALRVAAATAAALSSVTFAQGALRRAGSPRQPERSPRMRGQGNVEHAQATEDRPAAPVKKAAPIERLARRNDAFMIPRPVEGAPGQFVVDATWGMIMPMQLAPGVRTVGELEVLAHIEARLPLIDTRLPKYVLHGTLPSARAIAHTQIDERLGELDSETDTILFCNGPQCPATHHAIRKLLDAGHPPERLLYYRGGIYDWVTLGLPLEPAG
jgi:rhodanese-related sulfurtransferase